MYTIPFISCFYLYILLFYATTSHSCDLFALGEEKAVCITEMDCLKGTIILNSIEKVSYFLVVVHYFVSIILIRTRQDKISDIFYMPYFKINNIRKYQYICGFE